VARLTGLEPATPGVTGVNIIAVITSGEGVAVKQLIPLIVLCVPVLSACDAATRYDTGAVVLEFSEPEAFSSDAQTSEDFVSAYEALDSQEYARAEALLDRALSQCGALWRISRGRCSANPCGKRRNTKHYSCQRCTSALGANGSLNR